MTALNKRALEAAETELSRVLADYHYVMPVDGIERVIRAYMAALDPLPSSCSISVQHGVVTAAYDNDEDAMRVFKLLGDHHGA